MNPCFRATVAAAALVSVVGSVSAANHVDSLVREWLPLPTLTNYSWEQINAVCQSAVEAPGACSGSLGGIDLTGWTWASRPEVLALIGEFMVAAGDNTPPATITGPHGYGTNGHGWAQLVTTAMGITDSFESYTFGFTNGGQGDYAWFCHGQRCGWLSYAAANESYGGNSGAFGAWFYRAVAVPEPSSAALMLTGAAVFAGMLRRRA